MKVGLIIYGSLETLSGGYLYDRKLVAALRAAGCQVDVHSLPWRDYAAHLADNFRRGWARAIGRGGYDLILEDELNHPSLAWLNGAIRTGHKGPIVAVVHHLRSQEPHSKWLLPLYRAVEEHYLHTVDGFLYNSATTRGIVESIVDTQRPGYVAYPAADHIQPPTAAEVKALIDRRKSAKQPLQLLFVGNLIPRKGLHTVLSALAPLPRDRWRLHIVGNLRADASYTKKLLQLVTGLGLDPNLTWHGRLADADLRTRFHHADCFVLPSYEGFGIAYLEAMAFGLPVVALTTGAARELINHGINGFLVAPDDEAALTEHLTHLVQDRALLAQMAQAARATYDRHPTWDQSMSAAYQWLHEFTTDFRNARP